MAIDEDDVLEEQATKEPAIEKAPNGAKERKLYKGEVLTVDKVMALVAKNGVLPIQPVKRKYKMHGFENNLPPSFIVTRFQPEQFTGGYRMHYYHPSTGQKIYRDVPKDLELNVLSGTRATELKEEWDKALSTRFGYIARRLACTIGTDPEIFVVDKKGEVVPAWTYLPPKTKGTAYKTADGAFTGNVYWDGFQAEFTTHAGISCLAQMADCVHTGLKTIYKAARTKHPEATLTLKSVVQVSDKVLREAKPEHVAFGCAPSYNLYGLTGNTQDGSQVPYRFAGGHIHVGMPGASKEVIEQTVAIMDAVLGVAAVSMFAKYDNPLRRQYYGLPGEYRTPSHGLEYRTLSNAWIAHPLIMHMTFDLARAAAGLVSEGMTSVWKADRDEVVETILHHNVDKARDILKRNETAFKGILQTCAGAYMRDKAPEVAANVWMSGMESAIADPENIVENWKITDGWVSHSEGPNAYFAKALERLRKKVKV